MSRARPDGSWSSPDEVSSKFDSVLVRSQQGPRQISVKSQRDLEQVDGSQLSLGQVSVKTNYVTIVT